MTLYLVRHASAGSRGSTIDDLERPLDQVGREQALAVADRLQDVGVTQLCSSPARRCVETLEPLAARLGLDVEVEPALLEEQEADAAVDLIRRLARDGRVAALATHGDLIPEIIGALAGAGTMIAGPRRWEKGSTWQLETRGHDVVTARYLG